MEIESYLRTLRHTKDKDLRSQIAEAYPADFVMDELFQRSYQKYLENTCKILLPQKRYRISYHIISTAACLVLLIGAYLVVDFPQMRFPSVLEETTIATEQNAVSQNTSTSDPIVLETEIVRSTDQSRQTESGTELAMTTLASESFQLPMIQTTVVKTEKPTEKPQTDMTEAPVTSKTETMASEITEPQPTDCNTEPTNPLPPDTTDTTVTVTVDYDVLPGFEVRHEDGLYRITYCLPVEPSPEELLKYELDSEQFTMYAMEQKKSSCRYEVQIPGEDRLLVIHQYERTTFSRSCGGNVVLTPETVNGNPAFWVLPADDSLTSANCSLIWDDGKYTFLIEERYQHKDFLHQIAGSLYVKN